MRLIVLLIVFNQLKGYEQFSNKISKNIIQNPAIPPGIYELRRVSDSETGSIKPNQILNVRQDHGQMGRGLQFNVGPLQQPFLSNNPRAFQQRQFPIYNIGLQQWKNVLQPNIQSLPSAQAFKEYQPQIKYPENIQGYQLVHNGETSQGSSFPQTQKQVPQHFHPQSPIVHIPVPPPPASHNSQQMSYEQNHPQVLQNLHEHSQPSHQSVPQNFHVNVPSGSTPIPSQNMFQSYNRPLEAPGNFFVTYNDGNRDIDISPDFVPLTLNPPQNPSVHDPEHLPHQLTQPAYPPNSAEYEPIQNGQRPLQNKQIGDYIELMDSANEGPHNPYHLPQPQTGYVNDEGYQVVNEGPVAHVVSVGDPAASNSHSHPWIQRPANYIQAYQNSKREVSESNLDQEQSNNKQNVKIEN